MVAVNALKELDVFVELLHNFRRKSSRLSSQGIRLFIDGRESFILRKKFNYGGSKECRQLLYILNGRLVSRSFPARDSVGGNSYCIGECFLGDSFSTSMDSAELPDTMPNKLHQVQGEAFR